MGPALEVGRQEGNCLLVRLAPKESDAAIWLGADSDEKKLL